MSVHFSPMITKNCYFGIEVAKSLNWEQWEPGGEYTQQITLKNVNRKTKKLKYRIPNTNFFTTRYPQPIVLSSGTSINLPITFRPLEKGKYEDVIEFITKEGQFKVPMKAVLPEAALNFPEMINFGMCAVKDQLSLSFQILNTSDLQVAFQLKSKEPFTLSPTGGTLAPKTHCEVTAIFKPEGAFVYEVDAECFFSSNGSEKISKLIKLEGIGKYLHFGVCYGSQTGHDINIDYGNVSVGKVMEKTFEIKNFSPVDAPFQIIQKTNVALDNVFSCSQYHGIIPPESCIKVKLAFNPEITNTTYVDNFEVLAVGLASKACIKCIGIATGPDVFLETGSINFGTTKTNSEVTRSFKLRNNSSLNAVFQFDINPGNSVFKMDITSGVIEAKSTRTIIVQFVPTKPIVYYRKVFCLVQNQDPVTLELFGTCCTNEIKPVILTRQHLTNNKIYIKRGISRLSPEEITQLINEEKIILDENEMLQVADNEVNENLEKPSCDLSLFEEYMNSYGESETCSVIPHISLDVETIDFGKCKEDTVLQKTVSVSNHTHGKVTCTWINGDKSAFTVFPEQLDIEPLSSASFRVIFRPNEVSKFFNSELEAFVFYKSMRDHRLVDEKTIITPWCLTVNAMAHTFPNYKESFLPLCSWGNTTMVFPPVTSLTESVYRTCLLSNNGDNPIHYSFQPDDTKIFTCKPHAALVRDKYQLIVFRMNAMEFGLNKQKIKCIVNDTEKYSQTFDVSMTAELPEVTLSPKDLLYFKPTCIGNISERTVMIKNTSRIPLKLQWRILHVDESALKVDQKECTILSNEIKHCTWTFKPLTTTKHLFKVKLLVSTVHSSNVSKPKKYVLRLIGEGQTGDISCDEPNINFDEINVGNHVQRSICIRNNSGCSLHYHLCVDQTITSLDDHEELNEGDPVLKLDHHEFLLPSKANKTIRLTMAPKQRANYKCVVSYQLLLQNDHGNVEYHDSEFIGKHHLATVTVQGVYPQLQINDIRGAGCVKQYSKRFLWELLHLDNLNTLLYSDPSSAELKYHISSRHSTRRRMPATTKACNEFNFGSAIYGSEPCIVYLNIHNTGASYTEWALRYPTDFQLEMEYWADTGELDEDEHHEMYVMNSELFTALPRNGKINAGESQTVMLIYNHTSLGVHRLPVLLKIVQGREIKLNFVGTTLEPQSNTLHFTSDEHSFSPVSIGTKTSPLQSYVLHNGSGQTTRFAFDTSVLDIVQEDNYDHKIIECLTPGGEVGPYQSLETLWKFSPLEARSYSVGIPLLIENNESTIIIFHGAGYDPNQMGNTVKVIDDTDTTFPTEQLVQVSDQLLKLSTEYLRFGHISLFCEVSQLIFLSNVSEDRTISFRWILKGSPAENLISITPSSGFLKTGEDTMCKVKMYSQGPPAIHDFDIICEVIDETLMAQFKCDLKTWQKRREENKHLFTIRDVPEKKLTNNRPGSSTSKRLISITNSISRSDSDLRKYDALPPIKSKTSTDRRVIVEERPSTQYDVKPLPPMSYVSHLGVHVTTHPVEEYQKLVPEKISQMFIQRNPSVNSFAKKYYVTPASKEEHDAISNILTKLLKELIHDLDFMKSIEALKDEPIPYYAMLVPDLHPPMIENKLDSGHNETQENNDKTEKENFEMDKHKDTVNTYEEVGHVLSGEGEPIVSRDEKQELTSVENPSKHRILDHQSCNEFSQNDINMWDLIQQRQYLKRNDEMRYVLHDILENTISNILTEANFGEISLTSRPRLIALPPSANGRNTP